MAKQEFLELLKQGVKVWNQWRKEHPDIQPDLSEANLNEADLSQINLQKAWLPGAKLWSANLQDANLQDAFLEGTKLDDAHLERAKISHANLKYVQALRANLSEADLSRADLSKACFRAAICHKADFRQANLFGAYLSWGDFRETNFCEAQLFGAYLRGANLSGANLSKADLRMVNFSWTDIRAEPDTSFDPLIAKRVGADLSGADLSVTDLRDANLQGVNFCWANLSGANLSRADLTGCYVYATSAWDVQLQDAVQSNLVITDLKAKEPRITVDNIEVAQFIYLLLNHKKIRDILSAVTERSVLLLGRFGGGGLEVLQAMAAKLREEHYLPIIFDFERPHDRNYTETVKTLAGLSRFIIADLSGPSVPQELYATIPHFKIPCVPILESGRKQFAMAVDLLEYPWVVRPPVVFTSTDELVSLVPSKIIAPAEEKHQARQQLLDELFPS